MISNLSPLESAMDRAIQKVGDRLIEEMEFFVKRWFAMIREYIKSSWARPLSARLAGFPGCPPEN